MTEEFYWKTLDGQEGEIEGFCEEELQIKRVSYKERLYAQYANCEITKEELHKIAGEEKI